MAYPSPYSRKYGFQNFQDTHPRDPLPGNQVDSELGSVATCVNSVIDFVKGFTRSDGALANGSVGPDQVSAGFLTYIQNAVAASIATDVSAAATSANAAAISATTAGTFATDALGSKLDSALSAQLSAKYATKNDDYASGTDNSAKAWAIGGTGNGQPAGGDAKSWATKASGEVVTGQGYSAFKYAGDAATSAAAAAASAASAAGALAWVAAGGSADAITGTYTPAITSGMLVDGLILAFRGSALNQTDAPTFQPNALTARTLTRSGGTKLLPGDIVAGGEYQIRYNLANTRWELQNPTLALPGRNKVINGDMRIDQRNAGGSVTPTASTYVLDRWYSGLSVSSKFSVQQNVGALTPPVGFAYYLGVTSLSSYSVGSSESFVQQHAIEGLNCTDLSFGTASAKPVTVSFWVRSSLTGTFGGSLQNSAGSRSWPFSYTISSANTWERKVVTVPGDTGGTWLTNTGAGLLLNFSLGSGTAKSGTPGSWQNADYRSATGAVSVVGTNAVAWCLTGVQVETGSVATAFEVVDYATMFDRCERYYQMYDFSGARQVALGQCYSTSQAQAAFYFRKKMRTTPTATIPNAGSASGQMTFLTASAGIPGTIGAISTSLVNDSSMLLLGASYTAMFTAGNATILQGASTGTVAIRLDAEI